MYDNNSSLVFFLNHRCCKMLKFDGIIELFNNTFKHKIIYYI